MTPSEFRAHYNLSTDQFKRLKKKAAQANPDAMLTERVGGEWQICDLKLFIAHLPPSASPSDSPSQLPSQPSESTGAIARYSPAPLVEAELVPDVIELQIEVPDYSANVSRAQLEIAHTAHISSGNRNHRRALRRQAIVRAAQAEAVEDFALGDKAYEATMAQLEQQQLNGMGLGQSIPAPTPAPVEAPDPSKK